MSCHYIDENEIIIYSLVQCKVYTIKSIEVTYRYTYVNCHGKS